MNYWAEAKRLSYVMPEPEFATMINRLGFKAPSRITPAGFRDLYRREICDSTGWPKAFSTLGEKKVCEGIVVKSASGMYEGRTTGSRRKCSAIGCPGWFVGVLWETGQQMFVCSEGWHYDPVAGSISIIGGGEISARFVSPKPLGVMPLSKDEWPSRRELKARKGWRV